MQCIFIDAADSYAGPGFTTDGIIKKYFENLQKGDDAIAISNKYSLVRSKNGFTQLAGYVYKHDTEGTKEGGCIKDGKTTVNGLMECLSGIAEITETGNFYIINANSAHHFTFMLSRFAFQACIDASSDTSMNKKKVVVNIDNHIDYGSYVRDAPAHLRNKDISCGVWGGFHTGYWSVHCVAGAEYVVLSAGEKTVAKEQNRSFSVAGGGSKIENKNGWLKVEILNKLKTYNSDDCEIYLTVDRDFMKKNGTKYLDRGCLHTNSSGMKFVKDCIKALRTNGNIISADITGLPTYSDSKGIRNESEQFELAVKDIKKVHKYLTADIDTL